MTDSYREDSAKDFRIDLTYVGLIVSQCQTRFSIVVKTANVIKKINVRNAYRSLDWIVSVSLSSSNWVRDCEYHLRTSEMTCDT